LTDAYSARIDELSTEYKANGSLVIEERVAARTIPRWRVNEAQSYPWMTGTPWARADAFNDYIAQRLKPEKGLFAESGMKLDPKPEGDTTFSRHHAIHRFDERLVSIEFLQYHESYFGHAWRSEFVINWDLRRDRPLRLTDIFRSEMNWQQAFYDFAMKEVLEDDNIKNSESWFTPAEIDDNDAWEFEDEEATLLLGHGERSMVGVSAEISRSLPEYRDPL
jgi:hypothetical protein